MNYSEKLRDPRWQKKRLDILNRDEFTCQLCRCKDIELHVHHKEYAKGKNPWEYVDDNFITYCKICHMVVEANKDYIIHKGVRSDYVDNECAMYYFVYSIPQDMEGFLIYKYSHGEIFSINAFEKKIIDLLLKDKINNEVE